MKKNLVRIVALLLVAMLALTLLPLGALAAEKATVSIYEAYYDNYKPDADDAASYPHEPTKVEVGNTSVKIKASNYDNFVSYGDKFYDLKGLYTYADLEKSRDSGKPIKSYSSITIPKYDGTDSWYDKWGWGIDLLYTPHQHNLSRWISDGTTHWRDCLVCDEAFVYQTWCQDGDEDGICNVCGGNVPYHDVTVIESEGGKITVNKETASHRTKITADVEPAEGYKLKKLHFTKIREDGSEQEITRRKKDGQFWTLMPTYELQVSAEFVKN